MRVFHSSTTSVGLLVLVLIFILLIALIVVFSHQILTNLAGVDVQANIVAYIVAIPANEIVIPTVLMLTVLVIGVEDVSPGSGVLFELESEGDVLALLLAGGWTVLTAVNLMLFSLLHNPCSTTIYTIHKETGSRRWTGVAALLPLAMGLAVTFLVAQAWRLVAGIG